MENQNDKMNTNEQFDLEFRQNVSQGVAMDVAQAENNLKKKKERKWLVICVMILAVVLLVVSAVFIIKSIIQSNSERDSKMTTLTNLYLSLDEEMTYKELVDKTNELAPGATVNYDDGMYVIVAEGEPDSISCIVKTEDTHMYLNDSDDLSDYQYNSANLKRIVDEIMEKTETDEDGDEEDMAYNEEELNIGAVPTINPNAKMSYFKYTRFGEISDGENGTAVSDFSVWAAYDGDGYYYLDDNDVKLFKTKISAIDYLLKTVQ